MISTRAGRRIMVLGGARSGKSLFAENLVRNTGSNCHYLATGRAFDDEMQSRIDQHRIQRGDGWTTHEEPFDIVECLKNLDHPDNIVLIDCLTLWVTNLMMDERDMEREFAALEEYSAHSIASLVFVTNEVGLGIVPDNRMAREFRDHAGRLNQRIAASVDEVYFIAAGLPLKMKG